MSFGLHWKRPQESAELAVLQSPRVAYRGQYIAIVVAETLQDAREAARRLRVDYNAEPHDVAS